MRAFTTYSLGVRGAFACPVLYNCNGYIILKSNYLWDTLILASVPLFACAVSAAERRRRARGMGVSHEVSECSVVIAKLVR